MLSGKNREAAREALSVKMRDASFNWLQATYEEMCTNLGVDVNEEIMGDIIALRAEWKIILKRTQYVTCLH